MNTETNGAAKNGAQTNGAAKTAAKPEPAKPVAPKPFTSAKVNGRYTKQTQDVVLAALKKAGGPKGVGEHGMADLARRHGVTPSIAYWWWARAQGKRWASPKATVAARVERANVALASVNKERTAMTPVRTVRQLLADARKAGVVIKAMVVDKGMCKVTLEVTETFAL